MIFFCVQCGLHFNAAGLWNSAEGLFGACNWAL